MSDQGYVVKCPVCFQIVQVIRPRLHHLLPFGLVNGEVVAAFVGTVCCMGKLVFGEIRVDAQHFTVNISDSQLWLTSTVFVITYCVWLFSDLDWRGH